MNVKQAVSVLKRAKKINLCWNGNAIPFDKDDLLMMDAYGAYLVDEIAANDDIYEINIALRPVKGGAA
jgi:hypothetical protein